MNDYESVRQLIGSIESAASDTIRDVRWTTDAHVVGVSRDPHGRVELFLSGPPLSPASTAIREAIEFRVVHRDHQPPFDANRLTFPALGHFDQVAAFICVELLRNGADGALERAFAATEPIIDLAIEQLRTSKEIVLGLAGEILLLEALCRKAPHHEVLRVIESWDGWKRSSRDFALGPVGVEVKTTMGGVSSHFVEGVHQVERNTDQGKQIPEERLFLVSIGLQPASHEGNTFTIPDLVDRVIDTMRGAGLSESAVESFLSHVSEYGSDYGAGYDHGAQAEDTAYSGKFFTTFFRAYDMTDEGVQVLRRQDVTARAHVDVNSVRFRVDLPIAISVGNPIVGANQVAEAILR